MSGPLCLIFMCIAASSASAGSATQTDWSGGGSVAGPLPQWGDTFDTSASVSWMARPGSLYLSSEFIHPVEHVVTDWLESVIWIDAADMDGDGDTDLLGGGLTWIFWWENIDGAGSMWVRHDVGGYSGGFLYSVAADFDGDGDNDIASTSHWVQNMVWWENTDGQGEIWLKHTIQDGFGGLDVSAVDMDGDGAVDVLSISETLGEVAWWENAGTGSGWIQHLIDSNFPCCTVVHYADFDCDDDIDVVGAAQDSSMLSWWENLDCTGGNWLEHPLGDNFYSILPIHAADMNGDGYSDILFTLNSYSYCQVLWNENLMGMGWQSHLIYYPSYECCFGLDAGDIDGDGDVDAIGSIRNEYTVFCWENLNGMATQWLNHQTRPHDPLDGPVDVLAEDIDSDGDLDVAVADYWGSSIFWFEFTRFRERGRIVSSILDAGPDPCWESVSWTGAKPLGTDFTVELRAGADPGTMGEWTPIASSGDPIPPSFDGKRYLQYRITMTSQEDDLSPHFEDITVTWNETGIEGGEGAGSPLILSVYPNPSHGSLKLEIAPPSASDIEYAVFDLSGRLIEGASTDCREGAFSIQLSGFAPGVYLARVRSGDCSAAQRFVVIY